MPRTSETELRKTLFTNPSPGALQPMRRAVFDALRRMSSNAENLQRLRDTLSVYISEAVYRRDNGEPLYNNTELYAQCPNDPLGITQGLRRVLANTLDNVSGTTETVDAYRQTGTTIRNEIDARLLDFP